MNEDSYESTEVESSLMARSCLRCEADAAKIMYRPRFDGSPAVSMEET